MARYHPSRNISFGLLIYSWSLQIFLYRDKQGYTRAITTRSDQRKRRFRHPGRHLAPWRADRRKSACRSIRQLADTSAGSALMLAAQGLVTIVPRAGMFVHKPTAAELVAMFETLAEMEGVVARLATQRISPAGKKVLMQAHDAAGVHV